MDKVSQKSVEHRGFLRLFRVLKRYPALFIGSIGASLGVGLFEGGSIAILATAVTVVSGQKVEDQSGGFQSVIYRYSEEILGLSDSHSIFLMLILAAVGFQIVRSVLYYLHSVLSVLLQTRVRIDTARCATFATVSMSYGAIGRFPGGQIAGLVEQAKVFSLLVGQLCKSIASFLMLVIYASLLFATSVYVGVGVLTGALVLWFSMRGIIRKLKELTKGEVKGEIDLWKRTLEFLQAPKTLRILDACRTAGDLITEARNRQLLSLMRGNISTAAVDPVIESVFIAAIGVLIVGLYYVLGEDAVSRLPEMFIYVAVVIRVKPRIVEINQVIIKTSRLLPRLKVVEKFLEDAEKHPERVGRVQFRKFEELICFDNVWFRYPGGKRDVLRGATFEIPKGKTVAITGLSGGGKTTVLDLMLGLHDPTSGKITIDGIDLLEIDLSSWRKCVGVVEQDLFLLNASVLENLQFGRNEIAKCKIDEVAKLTGAHHFIMELKDGYDTLIGDRGYVLSGGQRQRLALCRALLREPEILVLDEAMNALDSSAEKVMQRAVREMQGQRTIFLVAHHLMSLRSADWLVILEDGRVVDQGPCKELLESSRYFRLSAESSANRSED